MAATTALMLLDFGWFREQVCMVACPYGRLQSVLLDRRSLIVGYDARRGEPRGKLGQRRAGGRHAARARGRLHRLRRLRRHLSHRHRHPRRAADGVHPLHAVHGRVRLDHGQGRPPARPHPLQLARRAGGRAAAHPAAARRPLPAAARPRLGRPRLRAHPPRPGRRHGAARARQPRTASCPPGSSRTRSASRSSTATRWIAATGSTSSGRTPGRARPSR